LQVSTDDNGRYVLTGLESGTYTVKTFVEASRSTRPPLPVLDQVYNGIPCRDSLCTGARGTPIPVTAGRTTPNIDFSLAEGGVISGVVTDAATGKPVVWARVHFYSPDGKQVDTADAAANGRYASGGMPTGTYLAVAAVQDSRSSLAPQVYKGRPCAPPTALKCDPKGGTPIVVTAPGSTTGIDFALASGGTISGAVTVAATGKPIPGARVAVYSGPLEAGFAANATTDQDGRYQVSGLPGGAYYVRAVPPDTGHDFGRSDPAFAGLLDQAYPGVGCTSGACEPRVKGEPVVVGGGAVVTGVDFRLRPGATVSGRVTDASSGKAVNRATVYFHAASGVIAGSGRSDFEGKYASSPLPPGQYYLRIEPPDEAPLAGALHPAVPYWLGNLSVKSGAPVIVEEGSVVTGKDFALAPGGVVRGKVTWTDSGKPVPYFAIRVYTQGGVLAATVNVLPRSALSDGTDTVPALPPGKYFVMAAEGQEHGYIDQAYRAVACPRDACRPTDGTPVTVDGPGGVSGIDFALEPGPKLELTERLVNLPAGRLRIEPDSGPASGGSLVTILGGPFANWRTKVLIGGVPAVSVEGRYRLLRVIMPPGQPGPADIVVTTPEGSQVLSKGYTYVAGQAAAPPRRQ
jgi:protocatechuate 3,4-dioxygenase beta subunit